MFAEFADPAFPVVDMLAVPLNFVASSVLLAVSGVIVLLPSVITPLAIFASVIPYPDNVVGFVPAVTCPYVFTDTDLYVPAVTPLVLCVMLTFLLVSTVAVNGELAVTPEKSIVPPSDTYIDDSFDRSAAVINFKSSL